jgi:hypothetical protein
MLREGGAGGTGAYVHQAREEAVRNDPRFNDVEHLSHRPKQSDRLQELAAALLYLDASSFGSWCVRAGAGPTVQTRSEIAEQNATLDRLARHWETEADQIRRIGDWPIVLPFRETAGNNEAIDGSRKVMLASAVLRMLVSSARQQIRQPDPHDPLIVERKSNRAGDDRVRTFIIMMAEACDRLFGNHLLGTVAVVANVVLGRADITKGVVQGVTAHIR